MIRALTLSRYGGSGSIEEEGGSFTTDVLSMFNGNSLTMGTGDVTYSIDIEQNSALTTTATGNLTGGGSVAYGSTLNLGANMILSASTGLNVEDTGSTLNLNGHHLTANELELGYAETGSVILNRGSGTPGTLALHYLDLGNGQTLHGGDVISTNIDLKGGSVLTVLQSSGGTGLTLNGTSSSDLTMVGSSMSAIDLDFTAPLTTQDWDLRWKDPSHSKNWISTLTAMIDDQQIELTMPRGDSFTVVDSNGYTYIDVVPEPSCLVLMGLGLAGLAAAQVMRRRECQFPSGE